MAGKILTFFFFVLFNMWLCSSYQSLAKEREPNDVLILGLIHSRASLPIPNASSSSRKRQAHALDMEVPLRGIGNGYLLSLNIGNPPQSIQVYMDTGSDLNWVPCGSFLCMDCDEYGSIKGTFSPYQSSSSYRDSCASPYCTDVHSSDNYFDPCTVAGCPLATLIGSNCSMPCPSFAYTYGGGLVTGTLTKDELRVYGRGSGGASVTSNIQNFCFGCVGSAYREPIGIAGFGRGSLSLPSQLGFLQKGFSHCFLAFRYAKNPNVSSPLVIGDMALSSKDKMQFTPTLKSLIYPNYYYIGLQAITVGNSSALQVPSSLREFDSHGNGGMLIDSGTTYTHLPEPLYSQLLSVVESMVNYPRATVKTRASFDLCYKVPCPNNTCMSDDDNLPSITFLFLNNASLTLPRGTRFYAVSPPINSTVVKCLLFQRLDVGDFGPAGIFGSFQQQNVEVVYDLENERIGFQPTDCASVAISQELHNK
ncbi:probable aspartyl protease At4g16563 [Manihot esculenta]|nr:probable aspartyl protease At4g16563 [Manihot esculenta]KAG8657556.1 hypothetical protein MANES_03G077200v8 [Manihot esculenta]